MKSLGIFQPMRKEDAKDYKHICARVRYSPAPRPSAASCRQARCRYIAQEYRRRDPRGDLFAASSSSITSRLLTLKVQKEDLVRFTFDASNAFFHAPCVDEAVVMPPSEWKKEWVENGGYEDVVWFLVKELYGRRKAPQAWTVWFAQQLEKLGMKQCIEAPWVFRYESRNLTLEEHMDDGHGCGSREDVLCFMDGLQKLVRIKEYFVHDLGSAYEHLKREHRV